jgi:hypothetical protein
MDRDILKAIVGTIVITPILYAVQVILFLM